MTSDIPPVMRNHLQGWLKRWPLLLTVAFTLYSALLLTYTVSTWQRMRQDANDYLVADNQRRATALGDLGNQLVDTVIGYADRAEIRAYLLNRDLGMSPRYGLNASGAAIEQRFSQFSGELAQRWNISPPRIIFYSEENDRIADSQPGSDALAPPLRAGMQPHMSIDVWRGIIEISAPVVHKEKRDGMVVLAIPIEIFYRNMLAPETSAGYRELLIAQDGKRPPGRNFDVALSDSQLRRLTMLVDNKPYPVTMLGDLPPASPLRESLLVKTPVPGTTLVLVTFLPEQGVYGHLLSLPHLIGAVILLLLMLFGAFRLDRMRRQAEALEASVRAAEQQRAISEIRNVELSAEVERRRKAESALAESQERWELAIAGNNDGIWDWNIRTGEVFFSQRWKLMLGYDETDFFGHIDEWSRILHPEDQAHVLAELDRHLRGRSDFYQCEQRLRCKDGSYKWILDRGRALFDDEGNAMRMAGSHTDISEQRAIEGRIADRNAQLDAIFSLSPDAFVSFDSERRVKYANPAFLQMTGYAENEIRGLDEAAFSARLARDCLPATPFCGVEAMRGMEELASAEKRDRPRLLIELAGTRKRVIDLKLRLAKAATVSQILYLRDVTHEAEVDRMKSEFLSHAAHELRTPMASIYGFTELLITQEFDAEMRKDLLETIHKQTAWLIEIINELLDISRIESRRGKDFKIEAVPVAPLVLDVLTAMQIDNQRWPVKVDLPVDLPPVRADIAKLRQILMNIIGNAVKYSPAGGPITISSTTRKLDGRTQVSLAVTDRGIGMTEEQAARVCERFYRADTSGNIPGTGLGMAIVKEVVELLGGSVDVSSAPQLGTTVTVMLPVAIRGGTASGVLALPLPAAN